jgi:Ca-activated chloride channel family protein
MGGTLLTIAKDVKVQVEFNPARVAAYRLIGYENRVMSSEAFNDDRRDGGELGAGHSVTALYEIIPAGADTQTPQADALRYQEVRPRPDAATSDELMTVKLRYKAPDGDRSWLIEQPVRDRGTELARTSDDFRFAAAVAAWGMLLRQSEHRGEATWESAAALARGAVGHDENGYRAEFLRLLDESAALFGGRRVSGPER